jgi:hypothetical protein
LGPIFLYSPPPQCVIPPSNRDALLLPASRPIYRSWSSPLSSRTASPGRGSIRLCSWGAESSFREAAKVFGELLGPDSSRQEFEMGERGKRKMARYEEFVDSSEGSAGRTRLSTTWSSLGGQKPCLPPLNPLGACPQENPARAVLAVPPSLCGARVLQTSFLVCPQMIGSPRGRRRGRWPHGTADAGLAVRTACNSKRATA